MAADLGRPPDLPFVSVASLSYRGGQPCTLSHSTITSSADTPDLLAAMYRLRCSVLKDRLDWSVLISGDLEHDVVTPPIFW